MGHSQIFQRVLSLVKLAYWANEKSVPISVALELREEKRFHKQIQRRDFLKITGRIAASAPFSSWMLQTTFAKSLRTPMSAIDPIVIIGCGLAGLTTAYRLHKSGIPCLLYDANNRFGGRVYTKKNFNHEKMFCELGGELVDSGHRDLIELCSELKVGIQDLQLGEDEMERQLFHIGGIVYTEKQIIYAFLPLVQQIAEDLKLIYGKDKRWIPTYRDRENATIKRFDRISLYEYLYSKKNTEKWLLELFQVLYVCEYGLELEYQSSLNFLTLISTQIQKFMPFGSSDESLRIQGGSSTLAEALKNSIQDEVPIYLEHQLVKIQQKSDRLKLTFLNGDSVVDVQAKKVVCTIPISILRNIEGLNQLQLNPAMKDYIRQIGYGTNSKLMLGFKSKPWKNSSQHMSNGALVSASEQQFWDTSRSQPGKSGILTNLMGGKMGQQVPKRKLENCLQVLEEVFPGARSQFDQKRLLQYWPNEPWAMGSYICFKPNQYTSFNGIASEPAINGQLLFAGDHTSIEHCGYMNGAIESGNRVAEKIRSEVGKNIILKSQKNIVMQK